jgi:hypothetical protein
MASIEKAKLFVAVSALNTQYGQILEALQRMEGKYKNKGDKAAVEYVQEMTGKARGAYEKMIEQMAQNFAEQFTDEELDELIGIYGRPVMQKLKSKRSVGMIAETYERVLKEAEPTTLS